MIDLCRGCHGTDLSEVLNLGDMPLAGAFLRPGEERSEKSYPLSLHLCASCGLVQVGEDVPPADLFAEDKYRSSHIATLVSHFRSLAAGIARVAKGGTVLEIGCNDGVLLKPLLDFGVDAWGIDPAAAAVGSANPHVRERIRVGYFGTEDASRFLSEHGRAKIVVASYSLPHIGDLRGAVKAIASVLADDGTAIVEAYHLGAMVAETQYDMIYHEHCSYLTPQSFDSVLRRHGLYLVATEKIPLRSGGLRFLAQRIPAGKNLSRLVHDGALEASLRDPATFQCMQARMAEQREDLRRSVAQYRRVIGYGASGRGAVIANWCSLKGELLAVVDDSPAKWGLLMPGTHQRIMNWEDAVREFDPDAIVLFAWPFAKEVLARRVGWRGTWITPLPRVVVQPCA